MQYISFTYLGVDGNPIQAYKWLPEQEPRAVVQIAHGMAEHAQRYADFAGFLASNGLVVYANDHRGHGQTATLNGQRGFFTDSDGWATVVGDIHGLTKVTRQEQALPIFLLGHSLGSLLSRSYAQRFGSELAGLILIATSLISPAFLRLASLLVAWQVRQKDVRAESPLLHNFTFRPYIRSVADRQTDWDWLSRDRNVIDEYMADPDCGGVFTVGYFQDLMHGLAEVCQQRGLQQIPATLPILLLAGTQDPVANYGADIQRLAQRLRVAGVQDVNWKTYEGARHELLNETNRDEVYADILTWLLTHLP